MFSISPRTRRRRGPYRLRFDRLEARMALAAGGGTDPVGPGSASDGSAGDVLDSAPVQSFSVQLIDPAPGSALHQSPTALTLQFNDPIFPDTLSTDVGIVQTDADGNPTGWYVVPDQSQLSLDETATRLTVNLDQTIPPGDYQVWIFGSTGITDLSGDLLDPDGNTLVLGAFDVPVAGVGLADAIDLGTLDSASIEVPGTLDFQSNPYAVSLYRVQLDPGHYWRIGAEVRAQRDGGSLDTALALFDSTGRPIAVDETGRKDAPLDPFLFAGLRAGTYYIGVSGTGNLPGPFGGYDPSTGSTGPVAQTQPGGPYVLHVVGDPVDTSPELRKLAIDRADAHSASPTGFTLGFNRAIGLGADVNDLSQTLSGAVEVRDEDGRTWPVQAIGYQEEEAQIAYLFDDPLPPGHYTIGLPAEGGLVDLAGLSPLARGEPPGILGTFDVRPGVAPADPHDLGAILPDAAIQGRSIEQTLGPGESATYRVVLTFATLYKFKIHAEEAAPFVEIEGKGSSHAIEPTGTNDTQLGPGEYLIRMRNPGNVPLRVRLDLRAAVIDSELLLANGVGQGPGLSLRLIAFPGAAVEPAPNPSIPPPAPGDPAPSNPPSDSAPSSPTSDSTASAPVIPAPINLPTLGTAIVAPLRDAVRRPDARSVGTAASSERGSIASVSFLGVGTDLIGRPYTDDVRGTSSEPDFPLSGQAGPLRGIAQGRTSFKVEPSSGTGLDMAWLVATDVVLDIVAVQGNPVGAAADSGGSQVPRPADATRPWTVSLRSAAPARDGLALRDPRASEAPSTDAVSDNPGPSVIRSLSVPDRAEAAEDVEVTDEADSWFEYLSPVIAALSAALIARAYRRFARWWDLRDGRAAGRIIRSRRRNKAASEPASSDGVGTWTDETQMAPTRLRLPWAS